MMPDQLFTNEKEKDTYIFMELCRRNEIAVGKIAQALLGMYIVVYPATKIRTVSLGPFHSGRNHCGRVSSTNIMGPFTTVMPCGFGLLFQASILDLDCKRGKTSFVVLSNLAVSIGIHETPELRSVSLADLSVQLYYMVARLG